MFAADIGSADQIWINQQHRMIERDILELAELQRLTGEFVEQITSMFGPQEAVSLIRALADQVEATGQVDGQSSLEARDTRGL